MTEQIIERCWQACWHRARRPVEGVLLSEEEAAQIAEQIIRNVAFEFDEFPNEAIFTARALEEAAANTKLYVAKLRREQADHQLRRDPEDHRYDKNLNLDLLQKRLPNKGFQDPEWDRLGLLLRPLALATLARKGIKSHDADEVYNDSLAELVRERKNSDHAPILDPKVFEEIIPLHGRIVGFRAIDWYRRRGALKNQPNHGDSLDELIDSKERNVQFADPASHPNTPNFEAIFKECGDFLTPAEWQLIFAIYVAQSATIQDLIEDPKVCSSFDLDPKSSPSTRRRRLNEAIEEALQKIRKVLLT